MDQWLDARLKCHDDLSDKCETERPVECLENNINYLKIYLTRYLRFAEAKIK